MRDLVRGARRLAVAAVAGIALVALAAPGWASGACPGDCDADGTVSIDELILAVNVSLGTSPVTACTNVDRSGDAEVTIDELIAAVGASLEGCPPETVTPVFPANYRETYVPVRGCRFSTEHGGFSVRVLANPTAAQPYLDETNPMPVGSVVVKEEYTGPTCDDADLAGWRVMRKEAPGFDPADGDWHWQWVETDRTVTVDDKAPCIGCHARPACLARDRLCTVDSEPERGKLQLALSRQPAAFLSISGTAIDDVYAVGADPRDGFGPYVLRYDGTRWRRLATGASGDLWWISVAPIDGAFYMAGANGLVLRYDRTTATFSRLDVPGQQLLFGIWGTAADDLWAVGGDLADEDRGGVLWHYDGTGWSAVDLSAALPDGVPTLYKVWGRTGSDVYVVGRRGLILRYDGVTWVRMTSNSTRPLFTIHGNESQTIASGGFADGVLLEGAGSEFLDRGMPGLPQMNGVFVPPDGRAVAVGIAGSLALRSDTGWSLANTGLSTALDFHATWVDPEGGIWAVGGDLSSELSLGMVAYSGRRTIGSQVVPLNPCPPPTPQPDAVTTVSYTRDIAPLLASAGCATVSCHGGPFPSSNYDVRTYEGLFGPGIEAKALKTCNVSPGAPAQSYLLEKLLATPRIGARMPNARPPLTDAEIQLVRTWITEGALNDAPVTPSATPGATTPTPLVSPTPTATAPAGATPSATAQTANCEDPGVICTVAGTGRALFNGDGKPALQTALYYPTGVVFDPQSRPLIVDWNNLRVRRLGLDGSITTIMGTDVEDYPVEGALAKDTPLHHASDVAYDEAGRLYVAGYHAPMVFRVGTDNRVEIVAGTTQAGNDGDGGPARAARLNAPFAVLPAGGGVYVSDIAAHVIRYVDAAGVITTVAGNGVAGYAGDGGAGPAARIAAPGKMRRDAAGNLYFVETGNHVVRRLSTNGIITTVAGSGVAGYAGDGGPATAAQFDTPYDLRFGPDGALYVADSGNSVIRRIDASGTVNTVVGVGTAGFAGDGGGARVSKLNRPWGLTFGADRSLWIADTYNNRIRRVAAAA